LFMACLGDYLGVWRYAQNGIEKYFCVMPEQNSTTLLISWAKTEEELQTFKEHIRVPAPEAERRILSKALSGYELIRPLARAEWTYLCRLIINDIRQQVKEIKMERGRRRNMPRKLTLLEWIGGMDSTDLEK